jgi:hypothetical protein
MVGTANRPSDQLLRTVVEQLKLPLVNIARQAELAASSRRYDYQNISRVADMAVKLIDSYLLSVSEESDLMLKLEPVSLPSVLSATADNLSEVAQIYNCDLKLSLSRNFAPVISERRRLEAAFTMLGYSFIEAHMANYPDKGGREVILSVYKTKNGTAAGVFSPQINISRTSFNRALFRPSGTRQSLPEFSQSAGAGIVIADALLASLSAKLRVAKHLNSMGLSTTLLPSQQLQLIS